MIQGFFNFLFNEIRDDLASEIKYKMVVWDFISINMNFISLIIIISHIKTQ